MLRFDPIPFVIPSPFVINSPEQNRRKKCMKKNQYLSHRRPKTNPMKKQIKPTVNARLIQGASLLVVLFLVTDVMPPALGQRESSKKPLTEPVTQWVWQNPLPQGNWLFGVSFTDANNGTGVGVYGTILRTTEGGQLDPAEQWDRQFSLGRFLY